MANITSALVEFLLNLLRDPQAAADFAADPKEVLDTAGLGSVTAEDVDACLPVVLDYAPVVAHAGVAAGHAHGAAAAGGHGHGEDHGNAVQQLLHVVNNYSYTNDNIVDQSVNQNIWANGDVTQLFDNDSVIASGAGAIAAGDDAYVDQSTNIDIDDSFNEETDIDIDDSFNEDNSTNLDVDIDDSFNEDNSVTTGDIAVDSFNDELNIEDNSTNIETGDIAIDSGNTDVNIEDNVVDSGNGNVVDSGNTDVDVDVDVEDVAIDSGNGNVIDSGNIEDNTVTVEAVVEPVL